MRLTSFTDFGLRALMRLAGEPGATLTTQALSREFAISRHHLTKVVLNLGQAGILANRRGGRGGLRLARAPDAITVGDVVRALEGRRALVECFRDDGGACTLSPRCRLKHRLAAARESFLRELDGATLADIAMPAPGAVDRWPISRHP